MPSSSNAKSVVMALSEARVSLAWISRVSAGMSWVRVKRVVGGGLGVIFFMAETP